MSFKVGDEVICVAPTADGEWIDRKGAVSDGPKYKDELVVSGLDNEGYLMFKEYKVNEGYNPAHFRKKQKHTFKNSTTANLASRIREEKGIERILIKEKV